MAEEVKQPEQVINNSSQEAQQEVAQNQDSNSININNIRASDFIINKNNSKQPGSQVENQKLVSPEEEKEGLVSSELIPSNTDYDESVGEEALDQI